MLWDDVGDPCFANTFGTGGINAIDEQQSEKDDGVGVESEACIDHCEEKKAHNEQGFESDSVGKCSDGVSEDGVDKVIEDIGKDKVEIREAGLFHHQKKKDVGAIKEGEQQ